MKFRSLIVKAFAVATTAALVSGLAVHGTSAKLTPAATRVSIRGNIGAAQSGWRVFMVAPKGGAKFAVVQSDGSFAFNNVLKRLVKDSTLQVVTDANRYYGPIVLAKEKVGSNWCAHSVLSGETLIGVTYAKKSGAFVASTAVNKAKFTKSAAKSSIAGVPVGAGTGGVVKLTNTDKRACLTAKIGAYGNLRSAEDWGGNPDENAGLGEDLDGDGLPNAFDADDDGDRQIDAVDETTRNTAALNPWVSMRTNDPSFNANINGDLTDADVAAVLGDPAHSNDYVIQFFVGNRNFTSTDLPADDTINDVEWVYVDCGELVYCGGDSPTALDTSTHLGGDSTAWSTYLGGWKRESEGVPASSALIAGEGFGVSAHGNALWAMNRNGYDDPERIYWRGAIFPNQGANTLATVRPGDVFTLNYLLKGVPQSLAMMLNPHAVTVPGLTSVNGSPYGGSTITMNGSGLAALVFYRPQRLTAPGEIGGGGDQNFMDMGGLQYGVSLMVAGHNGFGCPSSTISALSGLDSQVVNGFGWPMIDQTKTDRASSLSNSQIGFTIDFEECIKAANDNGTNWGNTYWAEHSTFDFELTAAGVSLTGGSNVTSLQLLVSK